VVEIRVAVGDVTTVHGLMRRFVSVSGRAVVSFDGACNEVYVTSDLGLACGRPGARPCPQPSGWAAALARRLVRRPPAAQRNPSWAVAKADLVRRSSDASRREHEPEGDPRGKPVSPV